MEIHLDGGKVEDRGELGWTKWMNLCNIEDLKEGNGDTKRIGKQGSK